MPFAAAAHPKANSCVIACSREAKILGLKNVMSIAEAKAACPELVLVPQKPDLYRRAHNTLLSEISTVIPIDAVKSIDKMTCRLEPTTRSDPLAVGRKIKARILNHVTPIITCSVGYAANRQLAKMACKAGRRVDGGYGDGNCLWHPNEMPGPLVKLKLSDVPGIGSRMELRLAQCGVSTMQQLLAMQPKHMRKMWRSVNGERLLYALHGYDIQTPPSQRGMYGHGRVLPPESRSFEKAKEASRLLLTKAARRMRRDKWNAGCLLVFLSTGEGSFFRRAWLPAVRDDLAILRALVGIWNEWRKELSPRVWIITVSVTLADITRATERQLDILLNDDRVRRRAEAATDAMDKINMKYGKTLVHLGVWTPPPGGYAGGKISYTRIPSVEDFW